MPTPEMSEERRDLEIDVRKYVMRTKRQLKKALRRIEVIEDEFSENVALIPEQNLMHDVMNAKKYTDQADDWVDRAAEALEEMEQVIEDERQNEE